MLVRTAAPPAVLHCSGEPPAGMKGELGAGNGLLSNALLDARRVTGFLSRWLEIIFFFKFLSARFGSKMKMSLDPKSRSEDLRCSFR